MKKRRLDIPVSRSVSFGVAGVIFVALAKDSFKHKELYTSEKLVNRRFGFEIFSS